MTEKLKCPKCGNTSAEDMKLFITDKCVNRYYFVDYHPNGTPLFEYGKNVHCETSDEKPTVECYNCGEEWEVSWDQFRLDL